MPDHLLQLFIVAGVGLQQLNELLKGPVLVDVGTVAVVCEDLY